MTTDPNDAAINDARALLDTLLANNWCEAHVSIGGTEIFIARDGGGANPMRARVEFSSKASEDAGTTSTVVAPHVATLVSLTTVGTVVAQGAIVATIAVLGQKEAISAPAAGRVAAVHAETGRLLEFGTPILDIAVPSA